MSDISRCKELLEILGEYCDVRGVEDFISSLRDDVKKLEVMAAFGVKDPCSGHYTNMGIDGCRRIVQWGSNATICWEDDGRQPDVGETLYMVSFPTGPYIFGDHYPQETFQGFFRELKSYVPKYCDTANRSLYFTGENGRKVHKDFKEVFDRWAGEALEEAKRKKLKELEAEIERLKQNN